MSKLKITTTTTRVMDEKHWDEYAKTLATIWPAHVLKNAKTYGAGFWTSIVDTGTVTTRVEIEEVK